MNNQNTDSDRYLGMGAPWFFLFATVASAVPAYLYARSNYGVLFQKMSANGADCREQLVRIAVLIGAAILNVSLSIFLYFSVVSQYALGTALLSLLAGVSIFHPEREQYSKLVAATMTAWTLIIGGIVLGTSGILANVNKSTCQFVYQSYASVMCKDGWLTFCTFCGILILGATFLMDLLLINFAVTDAAVVQPEVEVAKANGEYKSISDGYGATESTRASVVGTQPAIPQNEAADAVYTPTGGRYEQVPDDS